jgi:hypothetical protein
MGLTNPKEYDKMPKKSDTIKKETQMIEFKFSTSGSPVIVLGDLGSLIFSNLTYHPQKGYKYLCFSHDYDDIVHVKKGGERRFIKTKTHDTYTCNMRLERKAKTHSTKAVGLPHKALPGRMKDYIKKCFEPYIDDEGYISKEDLITKIKRKFHGKKVETILGKVQKKRKKRKKKNV